MESDHFIQLLKNSACMVGNSSVGIRECSALGVPAVNIGSRQRGRERGSNVVDCIPDADAIVAAVKQQLAHGHYPPVAIYGDGDAGVRIADRLATVPFILKKHLLPS